MAVPYTFGSATTSIPLSQLDSNFATTITLGNTAIQLGNTVTTLNNMTLANATVSATNVTATNITSPLSTALTLQSNAGNTAVTIDTSQKVGIGNASPSAKLDVATSTAGFATILTNTNGASDSNGLYIKSGTGSTEYNLRLSNTSGSTDFMAVKGNGNVGIGTTSPSQRLDVSGSAQLTYAGGNNYLYFESTNNYVGRNGSTGDIWLNTVGGQNTIFGISAAEKMRLDSSGNLLVRTTTSANFQDGFSLYSASQNSQLLVGHGNGASSGNYYAAFYYNANTIGTITQNGTTAVAYNTSSDYRLKENIAPLTGALNKVVQLKPVTYTWKSSPEETGEGFIAHELAEVCPQAVHGTKDELDADGNPKYQGIDTSFLVATLTAAIQELKAINDTQAETINALTARIVALEAK